MKFWATPYESRKRVVRRKVTIGKNMQHLDFQTLWKKKLDPSEVRRIQGRKINEKQFFL